MDGIVIFVCSCMQPAELSARIVDKYGFTLACTYKRISQTVLVLSVPPEDPVVDGSPELLLMAGTPYNLTCVTRGAKPAAHIQWTKDGVAVEGAYHSTVSHTHTSAHRYKITDTHVQGIQYETHSTPQSETKLKLT